MHDAKHYSYAVAWSPDDEAYISRVLEFPSLGAHGDTQEEALAELRGLVSFVLADLKKHKEKIPVPLGNRTYSGKVLVRLGAELHRRLAADAERAKLSLNQLITQRLAR